MKKILLFLITLNTTASAQTLFSYGKHTVSRTEFLKAYTKNNSDSNNPKISYSDYLDLYARFRMKVQAAIDERLDTTQQQRAELQTFRDQLAENFLKEDAGMKLLTGEAVKRSLKDIHLTDIYVPLKPGPTADEIHAAEIKIKEAYNKLQSGEEFEKVAAQYNYADLGFITVFVLPYEIENIAYTTAAGKYSAPYQTSKGFHIFRPVGERKAFGKIRIAQILLTFPPGAGEQEKHYLAQRADSAYNALKAGADFADLALKLSNDNLSFQNGGQLPVFGIGQYDPAFEKAAFDIDSDGAISKPVETLFGYHILSRVQRIPVVEDINNKEWNASIKQRVEQSDRMKVAQLMLVQNIRRIIKKDAPAGAQDSDTATLRYYLDHLEKYSSAFGDQLQEFKEGNLLFTIMQKNIWDAASADSAALIKFFTDNKNKYWWENSADALIVTCQNKKEIEEIRSSVKVNFPVWKKWAESSNGLIQADSGRYELAQIPVVEKTNFIEGLITAPVANNQDSSMTFAYIIKLYKDRGPRKFEDAKGAVINDFQVHLENKWLSELKQKYPVKINTRVFKTLP